MPAAVNTMVTAAPCYICACTTTAYINTFCRRDAKCIWLLLLHAVMLAVMRLVVAQSAFFIPKTNSRNDPIVVQVGSCAQLHTYFLLTGSCLRQGLLAAWCTQLLGILHVYDML